MCWSSAANTPLARAILDRGAEAGFAAEDVSDFQALPGNGLTATWQGHVLRGGNRSFMEKSGAALGTLAEKADALAGEGKTPLYFSRDGVLLGIIAVADVMKDDSAQAIREMQAMGIHVVMLTGDNQRTAAAIGRQAGVDEVVAGVLPDGKEQVIRQLQQRGQVAMVGDGINDAPALTRADIGVAIGAGADVPWMQRTWVLMKSRLSDVPAAIRLSRATLRNIHENLFWAFIYNVIGIPLAAGALIPLLHLQMDPMFGAAAMSLSSFCVVTNALRLNFFKLYDATHDHKRKYHKKEIKTMEKTMKIEGMMCGHCEATVKKALENVEGVTSAQVSHESGTAVVTLSKAVGQRGAPRRRGGQGLSGDLHFLTCDCKKPPPVPTGTGGGLRMKGNLAALFFHQHPGHHLGLAAFAVEQLEQHFGGNSAYLVGAMGEGGDADRGELAVLAVVEAHDRQILGDFHASGTQAGNQADGQLIIIAYHCAATAQSLQDMRGKLHGLPSQKTIFVLGGIPEHFVILQ